MEIMDKMSVEERMALAVLRGDKETARVLADWLCENVYSQGVREIPPINHLIVDASKIRVVVYFPAETSNGSTVELPPNGGLEIEAAVRDWLENGVTLSLIGAEKVELYQLP